MVGLQEVILLAFLEYRGFGAQKYEEDDQGLWRVLWAQSPSDFLVSEPFGWPFISYWAESLNVCEAKKNF